MRTAREVSRDLDGNVSRALTLGGMLEQAGDLSADTPELMAEFARLCASSVVHLTRYIKELRDAVEAGDGE